MEKKVISPIEIHPLAYFAKYETKEGKVKKIRVSDPRLLGVYLPNTVENPEMVLRRMPQQMDGVSVNNVPPMIQVGADIVRAKKSQKSEGCDLANFCLQPKIRYFYVSRKGEYNRDEEQILCEIIFDDGQKEAFCVYTKEITNICKIVKKRFATARIDFEIKNVEKMIEAEFREKIGRCPRVYRYYEQGWQMINGEMVYVNQSAKKIANVEYALTANLPVIRCEREYAGMVMLQAFGLYDNQPSMSTMMMFSLLGVLYRPFREAGFPPRFSLFLHGKTGSMKTTIGKILYTQLADDKVRDTPRRIDSDTVVSFERALIESGYDTITLIDDYNPAKTRKKKAELEEKLESIIRLVGDMSTKSRSNVNLEDCRGEGVQGIVVLTGELRGKGVSSNLRCLYCKMTREKANLSVVTWFQENPMAYTTAIYEFADYVGKNWMSIVKYIKQNFTDMRLRMRGTLSEKRLLDAVITLQIVYYIMRRFLREYCNICKPEEIIPVGNIEQNIMDNALMSQAISTEDSPSALFIKTINDLMRVGTIVLGTGKIAMYDIEKFDGFDDSEYFYFNPEAVFKKVRSFYSASNIDFAMDLKEMIVALYDDGIIKPAPNGKGKQTYCVRIGVGDGKKQSFLKISKEVFRKVLDDSMDIVW